MRLFMDVGVGTFLLTRLLPTEVRLFGIGPVLFSEHPAPIAWLSACYALGAAASAHWIVLRRRRPLFMESVIFVLNLTTFSFLLAPVGGFLSASLAAMAPGVQLLADLVPPLALAVYWIFALRRFNESDRPTNAKDALLIYGAFVLLVAPLLLGPS